MPDCAKLRACSKRWMGSEAGIVDKLWRTEPADERAAQLARILQGRRDPGNGSPYPIPATASTSVRIHGKCPPPVGRLREAQRAADCHGQWHESSAASTMFRPQGAN
jgi:hypothetical protein